MRRIWIGSTLAVLGAGALLIGGVATAKDDYSDELSVACTVCHDKPGSKLLTDKGKYYEATGSFEGYDEVKTAFASCTECHVKRPGSAEMTEKGKKFSELVEDMDGLRQWVEKEHPKSGSGEQGDE